MKTQIKFSLKHISIVAIILMALIAYNPLYAQSNSTSTSQSEEITVKGSVNDENGPLLGASITLKNSKVGTVSDENGAFTFPKTLKSGDVLVFSFLGYEMKEVKIKSNTTFLKVILETDLVEILGALESNTPYKSKRSN
ncbi:carboxypeptidase-like regulatory domain-containing protein [Psychroserpens sp. MEBiC05023]